MTQWTNRLSSWRWIHYNEPIVLNNDYKTFVLNIYYQPNPVPDALFFTKSDLGTKVIVPANSALTYELWYVKKKHTQMRKGYYNIWEESWRYESSHIFSLMHILAKSVPFFNWYLRVGKKVSFKWISFRIICLIKTKLKLRLNGLCKGSLF